jgi:hypothetical protein
MEIVQDSDAARPTRGSLTKRSGPVSAASAQVARARKALGFGLLLFAGLQLGTAVVLDHWRYDLRYPEFGHKLIRLRKQVTEHPQQPLLLVLGSSRTGVGLRPELLASCRAANGQRPLVFNFGLQAAGPVQELLCLNHLLDEGIRPAWVMIEVLPHALSGETPFAEPMLLRLGLRDLGRLTRFYPPPPDVVRRWCQAQAVPWSSCRLQFMTWYATEWVPWYSRTEQIWGALNAFGWGRIPFEASEADPNRCRRIEQDRQAQEPALRWFHFSPASDGALREMLTWCQSEGIPAGLFLMPEHSAFRSWYPPATWTEIAAYLARISREFHVPLIDARCWVKDTDFWDGHHLLVRGATVFTRRFRAEGLQPFLDGKLPISCPPAPGNSGQRPSGVGALAARGTGGIR